MQTILGLHHMSSIVKNPQENLDYYASVLGMRFLLNTTNHEDKNMYHLYYGTHDASGGISTYFPMQEAEEGLIGDGQVGHVTYAVRNLDFWKKRLDHFKIDNYTYSRFNEHYLAFTDPHGLELEFIEVDNGIQNEWEYNGVDKDNNIRGFHKAALYSKNPSATQDLFTRIFGYTQTDEDEEYIRLTLNDSIIDLKKQRTEDGVEGQGTVHHIALSIPNGSAEAWKKILQKEGFLTTAVKDRFYFESLYFREKGGITIELATEGPGLIIDSEFVAPPHFKKEELAIKNHLAPLELKEIDSLQTYGYRNMYEYDILRRKNEIKDKIKELNALPQSEDTKQQLTQLKKDFVSIK